METVRRNDSWTFLGRETINFIEPVLDLSISSSSSLDRICDRIKERLFTPVSFPCLVIFRPVCGLQTAIGHVAVYPDFDEIHKAMLAEGLVTRKTQLCRSWLFKSESEAGWFFKEKFCVESPHLAQM